MNNMKVLRRVNLDFICWLM